MAQKWKLVPKAVLLQPGDRVRHYAELMGTKNGKRRRVSGWSEVGVVVQTYELDDFPGVQDCLIAFVGTQEKHFHPKDFDGARPYILRYYNTSVVKL